MQAWTTQHDKLLGVLMLISQQCRWGGEGGGGVTRGDGLLRGMLVKHSACVGGGQSSTFLSAVLVLGTWTSRLAMRRVESATASTWGT